ncbi:MAG: gliding motility protein GldM [Bacteroidota bacterium]
MSIPKQPRQLMINLMYLVLTAMLALNVSAEILNGFVLMDKGIEASNQIVAGNNDLMLNLIRQKADKYPKFKPQQTKAEQAQQIADNFRRYVQNLRQEIVTAAGGLDTNGPDPTLPKRKNDKDIPTRILVKQGKGLELQEKIIETRQAFINILPEGEQQTFEDNIALRLLDVPDNYKGDWSTYHFKQMPVAAVLPIILKFEADAQSTAAAMLNKLLKETGDDIILDQFEPVASASQSYILNGETYEAEIFLGSGSSQMAEQMEIKVNGRTLPIRNGKVQYRAQANRVGKHNYTVEVNMRNPITEEIQSYTKTFEYEVGEGSVAISPTKMNVLYMGVDNPLDISAAGSSNQIDVSIEGGGGQIKKLSTGQYIAKVSRPTRDCKITVRSNNIEGTKTFRVKPIPDPIAAVGDKSGGKMSPSEMKIQDRLRPTLPGFDFEAKCVIKGFELAYVPHNDDAVIIRNSGGNFSQSTQRLVRQANFKDRYYFDDIKVKCPGDTRTRTINSIAFTIR